jgi:hypothetical protein
MPERVLLTRAHFVDLVAGKIVSARLGRHDRVDIELTAGALDQFIAEWRKREQREQRPADPPQAREFLPKRGGQR